MKKITKNKTAILTVTVVLVCIAMGTGIVRSQTTEDKPAKVPGQKSVSQTPRSPSAFNFPDYSKLPANQAENQTTQILEQRSFAISNLVSQVENIQTPKTAKAEVIYLLGALRAPEAVTVLIEHINFLDDRQFVADHIEERSLYRHTAIRALIQIGSPASQWIFNIIADDHNLDTVRFDKSQVDGFVEVLSGIDTPEVALMKLRSGREKAKDTKIKAQFDLVIAGIEKMAK